MTQAGGSSGEKKNVVQALRILVHDITDAKGSPDRKDPAPVACFHTKGKMDGEIHVVDCAGDRT